jgi:hypothetical protein
VLPDAAVAHYRAQQRLTVASIAAARRVWARMGVDFDRSWAVVGPALTVLVSAGQLGAARNGAAYVPRVLAETGQRDDPAGEVDARSLAGVASDGRELEPLLYGAVAEAKGAVAGGQSAQGALAQGGRWLDMAVWTQIADAARGASGVGIAARPHVGGYVRMLNPPSCSRCAVLAGKWFRYNQGFNRHPRCDCVHIPANEDMAGDLRTDPAAYFRSLSAAEQDAAFTKAGAEAIRAGADIGQVVNARRGARGLTPAGARLTDAEAQMLRGGLDRGRLQSVDVFGQQVFVTTEGTTTRGLAGQRLGAKQTGTKQQGARYRSARTPRLMPESLMQIAGDDRAELVRLLRRFGYIV